MNPISEHILPRCSKMAALIEAHSPLPDRTERDPYRSLVDAIISQQIATVAAANILARLEARFNQVLDPAILSNTDLETFRACGVSKQKATYIIATSQHFIAHAAAWERLPQMSDEEVIAFLTQIKGIGVWTAQMFLMFTLCRPDVFPVGDYGIRKAMHQLYGWKTERKPATLENKAKLWAPHRTTACMALWKSLDTKT